MTRPALFLIAVISVIGIVSVTGQPIRDSRVYQAGVELTSVAATVVDRDGRLITGLTREDFDIFEDGALQPITQFTNQRVPLSLGVLLDTSDSMHGQRLAEARVAVGRFLFDLLDPSDEFFLIAFNHIPRVLTTWTRDRQLIERTLEVLIPAGATAAYDAVLAALPLFETRERPRAAMLIISDGADTASEVAIRDLKSALLRSDAFVYAIAIDPPGALAINARVNVQALREITGQSGGRTEVIQTPEDLVVATQRIAEELNSQYLLGYTPPSRADGKYHSIRVRVRGTDYRVRARNGYVAQQTAPGS